MIIKILKIIIHQVTRKPHCKICFLHRTANVTIGRIENLFIVWKPFKSHIEDETGETVIM